MEPNFHNWLYFRDDGYCVEVKSEAVTLETLLDDFKNYLSACGYCIKPTEQIVIFDDEEYLQ